MDINNIVEFLITVLCSTSFATILNLVFTNRKNKYDKTVENVTNQRAPWRDKIKNISTELKKYRFSDEKKEELEGLLHQLELNINSLGYLSRHLYEKDGHIWNEIEAIKMSKNEQEFQRKKEVLLMELDFLLKEDWEKSKSEIYGKVFNAWNIVCVLFIAIGHAFLYFIVCGETEILRYILESLFLAGYSFFIPSTLLAATFEKRKHRREKSVKKILYTKKKEKTWKLRDSVSSILLIFVFWFFIYVIELSSLQSNLVYNFENEITLEEPKGVLEKKLYEEIEQEKLLCNPSEEDLNSYNEKIQKTYLELSMKGLGAWYGVYSFIYFLMTLRYTGYLIDKQRGSIRYSENVRKLQIQKNKFYIDEINELIDKLCKTRKEKTKKVNQFTECELILRILYIKLDELVMYIEETDYSRKQTMESYVDIQREICYEEVKRDIQKFLQYFGKNGKKLIQKKKKTVVVTDELVEKLMGLKLSRLLKY